MPMETIPRDEFADLVEHHSSLFVAALRQPPPSARLADEHLEPSAPPTAGDPGHSRTHVWRQVGELANQSYTWPQGTDHYKPFEVWESADARGRIQVGLGRIAERGRHFGKLRGYWMAFEMINGQKRRPIAEFVDADDFESSGTVVAVLKGKGDGGRSMFAPGDELPAGYERLTIEVFRDRVSGPQAYKRLAVVAEAGDRQSMCTHAFLQLGLRS
jgi:hypothetical protein